MRIASLEIRNFRGIREGKIRFGAHTVLVGPGNVGKTTIIEALALLLGRDRLIRELTEHDFNGSCPSPADRIRLVATITDFSTQNHADHHEWFRDDRAVPKYFDPDSGALHPARDSNGWSLACQIGFQARFDEDALLVETVRYFHDDDDIDAFDGESTVVQVPSRLIGEIGFYLVKATRTWDGVISFGSELFRRTIASVKGQPATAVTAERDRLRKPQNPIEQDGKLRPLVERIDKEMARLLPRGPQLQLRVSATDSRGVLDTVIAHFSSDGGLGIPAARQGSGLLSLQGLLLLLELARGRREAGAGFFMAVEEPELHVPPPSQGRLLRRIQALSPQSIITTHSGAVAAAADPTGVTVLRNITGRLVAEPLLQVPLTDDAPNYVRKYFIDGRHVFVAALMHETVLVPEGRSDEALLRAIAHALDARQAWAEEGQPSFVLEIGMIPTEDAKVVETHRIVSRLHPRVCCLVDGDSDGDRYVRLLKKESLPPARILRWPPGWGLERLAGWLVQPDERGVVAKLGDLDGPPTSAAEVSALLSNEKVNAIVYETIAAAIAESPACATRARELLAAIAAACSGNATSRFKPDGDGAMVFLA